MEYDRYEGKGQRKPQRRKKIMICCVSILIFILGFMFGKASHSEAFSLDGAMSVYNPAKEDYPISEGDADLSGEIEKDVASNTTPTPSLANTPSPMPVKTLAPTPAKTTDNEWQLTLVNSSYPMQKGYRPELQEVGNGYFDKRAAGFLKDMINAAKAEGLSPIICSSYRTIEKQADLYNKQVQKWQAQGFSYEEACEKAKTIVAYPGTSEHNLGLAVDIVALSYQLLDDAQAKTAEIVWLAENCYKYGFIVRYPLNKTAITGIIFEPWHFRYVGVEAATEIMKKGICLEEYLGKF